MIYLAAVSIAAIAGLVYLLLRSYEQNAELLDRIQAPERVQAERYGQPPNLSLGFDNDDEFWAAQEERRANA